MSPKNSGNFHNGKNDKSNSTIIRNNSANTTFRHSAVNNPVPDKDRKKKK